MSIYNNFLTLVSKTLLFSGGGPSKDFLMTGVLSLGSKEKNSLKRKKFECLLKNESVMRLIT